MKVYNLHKVYVIICVVIITLISCEKTKIPNECDPFDYCGFIDGPIYYYEPNQVDYVYPVFSTTNNEELICMRIVRSSDTTVEQISLVKLNYVSNTYETILTPQFLQDQNITICGYDWSSTGWIVIHDCNSNQLFKVQDDGTNLQQITFGAAGFYACYSSDGNSIYFSDYTRGFLMDANTGNINDTVMGLFVFPSLLNDGTIICSAEDNQVRIIDTTNLIVTNTFFTTPFISNLMKLEPIALNPNEVIFNSAFSGIFKLNLTSHIATLLKSACINRAISNITVSPDGTRIIYQLDSYDVFEDPCYIRSKSEFYVMNIDGSNVHKLELP